jgi:hypothetical protein
MLLQPDDEDKRKSSMDSQLSTNKKKKNARQRKGSSPSLERDMDAFNTLVKEYNIANNCAPRDFNSDLPILEALGAENFDHLTNMAHL